MSIAVLKAQEQRVTVIESDLNRNTILKGEARRIRIDELLVKYLGGLLPDELERFFERVEAPARIYCSINPPNESTAQQIDWLSISYLRGCPEARDEIRRRLP